jgi:hypothetical protein
MGFLLQSIYDAVGGPMKTLLRLIIICTLLLPGVGWGATYFIDFTAGSDTAAGTSTATAWKTIPGTRNAAMNNWQSTCWGAGCPGVSVFDTSANKVPAGTIFKLKSGSTHDSTNGSFIWIRTDTTAYYTDTTSASPILFQRDTTWGTGAVTFDGTGMGLTEATAEALIVVIGDGIQFDGVTTDGLVFQNSGVEGLKVKQAAGDSHASNDFALQYAKGYNNGTSFASDVEGAGSAHFHMKHADGVHIAYVNVDGNQQFINGFLFGENHFSSIDTTIHDCVATNLKGDPVANDAGIGFKAFNGQITMYNNSSYSNLKGCDLGEEGSGDTDEIWYLVYNNTFRNNTISGLGLSGKAAAHTGAINWYIINNVFRDNGQTGLNAYSGPFTLYALHNIFDNNGTELNATCTASNIPYDCCTGSGTGVCPSYEAGNLIITPDTYTEVLTDTAYLYNNIFYKPAGLENLANKYWNHAALGTVNFSVVSDYNVWTQRASEYAAYWGLFGGSHTAAVSFSYGANGPGQASGNWYDWYGGAADDTPVGGAGTGHLNADANSKTTAPAFLDVTNHNYHLTTADTTATGTGAAITGLAWYAALPAAVKTAIGLDRDGQVRPRGVAWDIGPYVAPKTQTMTVAASVDDAMAHTALVNYSGWDNIQVSNSSSTAQTAGIRWQSFIPKNATITSAYVQMVANNTNGNAQSTSIYLIDQDNAVSFNSVVNSTWNRSVTGSAVTWAIGAITDGTTYNSADISTIVQAYIDRAGYDYGDYIGVQFTSTSTNLKSFQSFDHAGGTPPKLIVTYTGGDVPIELRMADPHVRTTQYVTALVRNHDETDIIYATLDDVAVDHYHILAADVLEQPFSKTFTFDYTALTDATHHINVYAETAGAVARGTGAIFTWTTLHHGTPTPTVTIDKDNIINVAGAKFFPFGAWSSIYQVWGTTVGTDHEYNSIINMPWGPRYYSPHANTEADPPGVDDAQDYLDRCATYGFYGIVGLNGQLSLIDSLATGVKTKSNLFGYMYDDEPEISTPVVRTPLDVYGFKNSTRTQDTAHPLISNYVGYYLGNKASAANQALEKTYSYENRAALGTTTNQTIADIIGLDYYPYEFASTGPSGGVFYDLVDYLSAVDNIISWNYNLFPVMTFIELNDETQKTTPAPTVGDPEQTVCGQSTVGRSWTPAPTVAQNRNLIWLSIIHGVKGISWFTGFCSLLSDREAAAIVDYANVIALKDVILTDPLTPPTPKATYVSAYNQWAPATITGTGRVDYTVRDDLVNGKTYIFAARVATAAEGWPGDEGHWPDYVTSAAAIATLATENVLIPVTGLAAGVTISRYGEAGSITSDLGHFHDSFTGLQVRLYSYETTPPDAVLPTITGITTSVPSGTYGINKNIPVTVTADEAITGTIRVTCVGVAVPCDIVFTGSLSGSCGINIAAADTSADLACTVAATGGNVTDADTNIMTVFIPATLFVDGQNIVIDSALWNVVYIDPVGGSDAAAGTSTATAWKTPKKSISDLAADGYLYVKSGSAWIPLTKTDWTGKAVMW